MSVYVQRKYAQILTGMMNQGTIKSHSPFLSNFRCEICGDSQKNKIKKRGYLIEKGTSIRYACHNCGASLSIYDFLQKYHSDLFRQYWMDELEDRGVTRYADQPKADKVEVTRTQSRFVFNLTQLKSNHPAVQYILSRKLPVEFLDKIFYTPKFYSYINTEINDKFSQGAVTHHEHGRIILPITDKKGNWTGVIGRAIDDSQQRYITIKFDPDAQKVYGLDRLDLRKHGYITEGSFDSMFLDNAVAMAGADCDPMSIFVDSESFTIVLDNEPRNVEVLAKYSKYISRGFKIVIWPNSIVQKDINQMILDNVATQSEIRQIITDRTFQGLSATIEFTKWKQA